MARRDDLHWHDGHVRRVSLVGGLVDRGKARSTAWVKDKASGLRNQHGVAPSRVPRSDEAWLLSKQVSGFTEENGNDVSFLDRPVLSHQAQAHADRDVRAGRTISLRHLPSIPMLECPTLGVGRHCIAKRATVGAVRRSGRTSLAPPRHSCRAYGATRACRCRRRLSGLRGRRGRRQGAHRGGRARRFIDGRVTRRASRVEHKAIVGAEPAHRAIAMKSMHQSIPCLVAEVVHHGGGVPPT